MFVGFCWTVACAFRCAWCGTKFGSSVESDDLRGDGVDEFNGSVESERRVLL